MTASTQSYAMSAPPQTQHVHANNNLPADKVSLYLFILCSLSVS